MWFSWQVGSVVDSDCVCFWQVFRAVREVQWLQGRPRQAQEALPVAGGAGHRQGPSGRNRTEQSLPRN